MTFICERTDSFGNKTAYKQREDGYHWPGVFCRVCGNFSFDFEIGGYDSRMHAVCAPCSRLRHPARDEREALLKGPMKTLFVALVRPMDTAELSKLTEIAEEKAVQALVTLSGKSFVEKDTLGRWRRVRVIKHGSGRAEDAGSGTPVQEVVPFLR